MKKICDFCGETSRNKLQVIKLPRTIRKMLCVTAGNSGYIVAKFPKSESIEVRAYSLCEVCCARMALSFPVVEENE